MTSRLAAGARTVDEWFPLDPGRNQPPRGLASAPLRGLQAALLLTFASIALPRTIHFSWLSHLQINFLNNLTAITLEFFRKVLCADTKSEQAQMCRNKESEGPN